MNCDSESDNSDYEDVRPHFSSAQWDELSSYEKSSYRSAKENYHAMQAAGLAPRPPQFMIPKPVPAQRKQPAAFKAPPPKRRRSEDQDADWTPAQEEQQGSSRRVKFVPPKPTRPKPKPSKQSQRSKKAPVQEVPADAAPQDKTPTPTVDSATARYPKRTGSRKCYAGAEAFNDDDELYCDDCERSWEGECPVHGPLLVIPDAKVEPKDPQRALHTVPPQLVVLDSKIEGAGKGVWTKQAVPKRARFGPYEGDITEPNRESGYGWEIRRDGKPVHCVDALRESTSNWMRYVNCPRNVAEANLHPFQFQGHLYYRTVRDVPANTELLVWYGDSYGKELGIDPKAFRAPAANAHVLNGTFPCDKCRMCFVSPLLLGKHQRGGHCWAEIQRRRSAVAGGTSPEGAGAVSGAAGRPGKAHKCSTCGAEFSQGSYLRKHQRVHTGERPFTCPVCNKAFTVSSHLHRHQRTHTGEKPYTCTVCNKAFAESVHLHRHQRTHTGEKPFSCAVCNKAFTVSNHLQDHQRIHTGEKPFSCAVCNKAFTNVSNLHQHQRTHSGEKPFSCAVCKKAFTQAVHLHLHQRTHSGEKPFTCTVCNKAFTQITHLHQHQRTHSGEKPFSCSFCVATFSRNDHRRAHEQRSHAALLEQPAPAGAAVESAPAGPVQGVQGQAAAAPDGDAVSSTTAQPVSTPSPTERASHPLEPALQESDVSSTSKCSGPSKRKGNRRSGAKENRPPSMLS